MVLHLSKKQKIMNNNFNQQIKRLQKFNTIVEYLESYDFFNINKIGVSISSPQGSAGGKIETLGPREEATSAFISKFRFLLMNKDGISLNEINEIYKILPISDDLKKEYADLQQAINQYLDSETGIDKTFAEPKEARDLKQVTPEELRSIMFDMLINQSNKQNFSSLTRRFIMDTLIWGIYSHTEFEERNKKEGRGEIIERLQSSVAWSFIEMEFVRTVITVTEFAIIIKYLNEQVIKELEKNV